MFLPIRIAPLNTPPRVFVTLAEAKQHLRQDENHEDALIQALIQTATDHLDGWPGIVGRCLITQRWRQRFAGWPACGIIRLPFPNVSNIAAIGYRDAESAPQTFATTNFHPIAEDHAGAYLALKPGVALPVLDGSPDPVHVDFDAGYGPAASDVPAPFKAAILLIVGATYESRAGSVGNGQLVVPPIVHQLIGPLRRTGLA
jgi:uncharacterized phiE125 gp8 family phage protein